MPAGALPPAIMVGSWSKQGRNTHGLCRKSPPHLYLLLSNNLSCLQKACPGPGVGLGQGGPNGLDWFPGEALQCAAEGGRGLGMCSKGSGKMAVGRGVAARAPAWSGGCSGRAWPWCALLVVVMVEGGARLGHVVCGGSAGCLSKLRWVEVPSNQQSPQPFPGQSLSIPGGSWPCSPPRPASTALAKAEPRALMLPAGPGRNFCPQPRRDGVGPGRCGWKADVAEGVAVAGAG